MGMARAFPFFMKGSFLAGRSAARAQLLISSATKKKHHFLVVYLT
jgi:hypothetical protein